MHWPSLLLHSPLSRKFHPIFRPMVGQLSTQWESNMGEQRSRETQEIQMGRQPTDEAKREEPAQAEFEGYSLESLAVLEG